MIDEATREVITCPITLSIFHTPVILNGTSTVVEKEAMDQIIADAERRARNPDYAEGLVVRDPGNRTVIEKNPCTGSYYCINYPIRRFIESLMAKHPELTAEQYQPHSVAVAALPPVIQAVVPVPAPAAAVAAEAVPAVALRIPVAQQGIFAERRDDSLIGMPVAIAITSDISAPMQKGGHKEALVKVLCLGDMGSNKTQWIKQVVHSIFRQHYKPAIGVDFSLKIIQDHDRPDEQWCFQLWDIAGQDRFGNMTCVYYKGSSIALFFDTEPGTGGLAKWMYAIRDKMGMGIGEERHPDTKFFTISYEDGGLPQLIPIANAGVGRNMPPTLPIHFVPSSSVASLGTELLRAAWEKSQCLRTQAEAAAAPAQQAPAQEEPAERGCSIS